MTDAAKDLTDDDLRQFSDCMAKLPAPKPPQDSPDAARMERGRGLAQSYHCGFCHNRISRDVITSPARCPARGLPRQGPARIQEQYAARVRRLDGGGDAADLRCRDSRSRVFYGAGALKKQAASSAALVGRPTFPDVALLGRCQRVRDVVALDYFS
jgi:hypothetical protein